MVWWESVACPGGMFDLDSRLVSVNWQGFELATPSSSLKIEDWWKALSFILLSSNILSPDCVWINRMSEFSAARNSQAMSFGTRGTIPIIR